MTWYSHPVMIQKSHNGVEDTEGDQEADMNRDDMDRVINEHFVYEATDNIEVSWRHSPTT